MKTNRMKNLLAIAGVALASISLVGCGTTEPVADPTPTSSVSAPEVTNIPAPETTPETAETPAQTPSAAPEADNSVVAILEKLPVQEETQTDTYNRDYFNHWISQGSIGDTRDAVLAEEAKNENGVTSWYSVYDDVTTTDAGSFDIDHMVPLKEAWISGAYSWDAATREAYANDLGYEYSLIAVTASSNRSKSDQDPASWMPTKMDGCEYVSYWVNVKYRWNLSVDQAEKDKILSVLTWCEGYTTVVPEKADVKLGEAPVAPSTEPSAPAEGDGQNDPRFSSCKEANSNGYGPYTKGQDPEYEWYRDGDGDGTVCE